MRVRKVIKIPLEGSKDGVRLAGGVHAAVVANVHESGSQGVKVSSRQRIVQSSKGTEIYEEHLETSESQGGKDE